MKTYIITAAILFTFCTPLIAEVSNAITPEEHIFQQKVINTIREHPEIFDYEKLATAKIETKGMNWKEFIVSLIRYTAWPAIIIAALLIFKKQLSSLLKRDMKYDHKNKTFELLSQAIKDGGKINAKDWETLYDVDPDNVDRKAWVEMIESLILYIMRDMSAFTCLYDGLHVNKANKEMYQYSLERINKLYDYFRKHSIPIDKKMEGYFSEVQKLVKKMGIA